MGDLNAAVPSHQKRIKKKKNWERKFNPVDRNVRGCEDPNHRDKQNCRVSPLPPPQPPPDIAVVDPSIELLRRIIVHLQLTNHTGLLS